MKQSSSPLKFSVQSRARLFKIAHLPKKSTARAPKRELQGKVSQRTVRSIHLNAQSRADGRSCSQEMADAKAQTTEESQPRVTAKANSPNKLNPFNHFQLFCPRPICPGGRRLQTHSRGCRTAPTRKRTDPAGEILYTNQPGIRWSRAVPK